MLANELLKCENWVKVDAQCLKLALWRFYDHNGHVGWLSHPSMNISHRCQAMKCHAMKYSLVSLVACVLFLATALPVPSLAQSPALLFEQLTQGQEVVYLVQGERRQLSKDFVAELDGDQLLLSLQGSGLVRSTPQDELLVSLIKPSGERQDARPDARGNIAFSGLSEGLAAVVITADSFANTSLSSAYAAIPFFVATSARRAPQQPVAPGDAPPPPEVEQPQVAPAPLNVGLVEVVPENLIRDLEAVTQSAPTSSSEVMVAADYDLVPASRFRVQRLADGSVQGRVIVPQRGYETLPGATQVSFFQGSNMVSSTMSTEDGAFVARRVPVGMLGVVAVGPGGHAAYMVEIVEFQGAERIEAVSSTEGGFSTKFVATRAAAFQEVGERLEILLIPPALMDEVLRILNERIGVPAPAAFAGGPAQFGGGFGGGGGGGLGGGGGGGGFAGGGLGLLGVALIPALIAALDDDDDFFEPPFATPIAPPAPVVVLPPSNLPPQDPPPQDPPPVQDPPSRDFFDQGNLNDFQEL